MLRDFIVKFTDFLRQIQKLCVFTTEVCENGLIHPQYIQGEALSIPIRARNWDKLLVFDSDPRAEIHENVWFYKKSNAAFYEQFFAQ